MLVDFGDGEWEAEVVDRFIRDYKQTHFLDRDLANFLIEFDLLHKYVLDSRSYADKKWDLIDAVLEIDLSAHILNKFELHHRQTHHLTMFGQYKNR